MASMTSAPQVDSTTYMSEGYVPQKTERSLLPKVLSVRDITVFSLLTTVTLSSLSIIQSSGISALFYLLLVLAVYLVPRIFVSRWIARNFAGRTTPYHWISSRSRFLGFFNAFCMWWPGVLIVASAIETHIALTRFFAKTSVWVLATPLQQGLLIVALLLIAMLVACIPMRWLRYILGAIAIPYLSIFLLLGGVGIWRLVNGQASAFVHSTQHLSNNPTAFGLVIMTLLTVHIPLFFTQELKGDSTRRGTFITHFIWWSGILAVGILFLGTLGVLVITPTANTHTSALIAPVLAMSIVFGPAVAVQTADIFAVGQVAIISIALLLYSRILVVLAQEKALPQLLTRTNRYGVPVFSIAIQSLIAGVIGILFFVVAPISIATISAPVKHLLNIDKTLNVDIFHCIQMGAYVLLACTSSTMFLWIFIWGDRNRRKHDAPLKYRFFIMVASLIGLSASLQGVLSVLTHSFIPNRFSDGDWTFVLIAVIVLSLGLGWLATAWPRVQASLEEQRRLNAQEATLRAQLQESYEQQMVLLDEVNVLYHEHAKAAVTDAITGLPNHRAVMSSIDEMLEECRRMHKSCAILFTDLDHFKGVNDTWGHRAGDAILREVGRRFRETIRTQDLVGRYGGEEFAILLTDTDITEAKEIAERLRAAIHSEPCIWQEDGQEPLPIPVTTSIGVAVYSLHGTTRESLITSADQAMYRAKKSGRNRVCIADMEKDTMEQQKPFPSERHSREPEAIQALAAAASAHDGGTHDHSQRMIGLAEETARYLGRSEDEVYLIRLAALVHDIGKIGIPDAILHKPGPLTNDEWAVMRTHPDIGRSILERTGGVLRLLSNIVVAHHERWDGAGYPAQLTGENIPLGARILSVVDAYDAMTSQRTYRDPCSIVEAKTELQRCAGSQFDPRVVDAFLAILQQKQDLLTIDMMS